MAALSDSETTPVCCLQEWLDWMPPWLLFAAVVRVKDLSSVINMASGIRRP